VRADGKKWKRWWFQAQEGTGVAPGTILEQAKERESTGLW